MAKNSIAYVSTSTIGERPPPYQTRGPAKWLRENLFASPRDALLTVLFSVVVIYALGELLPWVLWDSVWTADNIRECHERGEGACFSVIVDRFYQILFGFYPRESVWRPLLTFGLMFLAIAPLLHDNLPRKLLWFSAVYPLLAVWFLWGGNFWTVLLVIFSVAASVGVFVALKNLNQPSGRSLFGSFVFLVVWFFYIHEPVYTFLSGILNLLPLAPVESAKFGGFMLTFIIGVTGISLSLPIGIVLALGRKSDDMPVVKMLCVCFIEFIRGVPLITLLFIASTLLQYFLPPETTFDLILRVLVMVTLFSSGYIAEVIRGGLAALPRGQYEAADALGLNYWQSTRLIILPQALKISIPGIVGTFIGLFKDTTLVSIIGLLDPIGVMQPIRSHVDWTGIIWELPVFVGLVFFIFCFTMSRYAMYFERKLDTEQR